MTSLPWPIALVVLGGLAHHALMRWFELYATKRLQRAEVDALSDDVARLTKRLERFEMRED